MDAEMPPLIRDSLGGESVRTRVELGGDDAVFVTPSRSIVYRSEGLLSDEAAAEYPHEVERLNVMRGRRKATFRLEYVDGRKEFSVPASRADDVLEPVLEGVLAATGVTEKMERVEGVYRFSELTLVVTDGRVLKHVGNALWDGDFEEYPFAEVTGLDTEEGSVSTGLVVEVNGRPQRVKIPSDEGRVVTQAIENAVLAYHEVDSIEELQEKQGVEDQDDEPAREGFDDAKLDPLVGGRDDVGDTTATETTETIGDAEEQDRLVDRVASTAGDDRDPEAAAPAATDVERLERRLEALEERLDRQTALLEHQQELVEQLVDELQRER